MARFPNASAFAWVDDDIILTTPSPDRLQEALHRSNGSVLVTADPSDRVALNTGVFIVRNDAGGREVLEEIWRRATAPRHDGRVLATDTQSSGCLHEQQALEERLHLARWRTRVAVLEQRADERGASAGTTLATASPGAQWNLNTFLRCRPPFERAFQKARRRMASARAQMVDHG